MVFDGWCVLSGSACVRVCEVVEWCVTCGSDIWYVVYGVLLLVVYVMCYKWQEVCGVCMVCGDCAVCEWCVLV